MAMTTTLPLAEANEGNLVSLVMAMATTHSLPQKRKEGIASKKKRVEVMVMTPATSQPCCPLVYRG